MFVCGAFFIQKQQKISTGYLCVLLIINLHEYIAVINYVGVFLYLISLILLFNGIIMSSAVNKTKEDLNINIRESVSGEQF